MEKKHRKKYTMRKDKLIVCGICGREFFAFKKSKNLCERCFRRKKRDIFTEYRAKEKGVPVYSKTCQVCFLPFKTLKADREICTECAGNKSVKRELPAVSLADQMKLIADYNREHGTNYTYGEYDTVQRLMRGEFAVHIPENIR